MFLGNLLKSVRKDYRKIQVKGISFDSRKVKKKDIFFAVKGVETSGVNFINEAVLKGASAVVSDRKNKNVNCSVPLIIVDDARRSLSEACSKFYKNKLKKIVAVTGTNGKSSVANFFYQIMNFNKISVASIGTLGIFSKNYNKKTNLTSMDPLTLHKSLQILSKNRIQYLILEASSHGLSQKRLDNLKISTGIFTNLSHDHLDYHKSKKKYFNSKMHLFKNLLNKDSKIITDVDNKEFKTIKKIANKKMIKMSTIGSKSGNIKILYNKYIKNKQIVKISINSKIYKMKIPLIGFFQLKNFFMAVLAAINFGLDKKKIFDQVDKIKPVPGRLEHIACIKNNSNIILDFAHTPDALEQSLIALKDQFKRDIVVVFGCGGDRDKKKRFIMGKIAKKYCRKIFVTDDNPRSENPKKIREEIIRGCKGAAVDIGNRKKAIMTAIQKLGSNEVLLVTGKGHEEKQDYGNKVINFSDKKIIKEIIKKGKFFSKKEDKSFLLNKVFGNIKKTNYSSVCINSKNVKKNDIFFAIKGKKKDGHKFASEAINKGAIKLILNKKIDKISKNKIIKVKNTLTSLNNLAKATRESSHSQIIGITGSVGKTTLKNLVGYSLENYGKVYYSPHSYNNKYGVPLSLSNLKSNTDYGVFEIGMDKKGEINNLSKFVKPDIGIITNISGAHLKNFNSLNDIARAKAEIINNISKGGDIILNKDEKFFNFFSKKSEKKGINITSFSLRKKSDISLLNVKKVKNYFRLKVKVKNNIFYFTTKYSTLNFINNFLACISVMFVLKLNLKKMEKKFTNFKIPPGRGDLISVNKFNKKFILVDESYNANPLSMSSAIRNMRHYNLKKKRKGRKLAFLGDMLELGSKSKKFHKNLSIEINRSDIDKVFVCGKYIKETFNCLSKNKKGKIFKNLKEAHEKLGNILHNNDILMIKGSNATGLNRFSKNIKKEQISAL